MKNQPLGLDPEGMEHRKHAESSATNDMVMGTGSKLKMVEPKLKKAWEGNTLHRRVPLCVCGRVCAVCAVCAVVRRSHSVAMARSVASLDEGGLA